MDPFVRALQWLKRFEQDQEFWEYIKTEFPDWKPGVETV